MAKTLCRLARLKPTNGALLLLIFAGGIIATVTSWVLGLREAGLLRW
jgi:hypothetical protein